mgnify:FL=1
MSKFCTNCGQELDDNSTFCYSCGKKLNESEEKVNNEKSATSSRNDSGVKITTQKSKIAAGLFGIFLGSLGIHNFYLGYNSKAMAQLLISVLSCFTLSFISGIWGFIEGILILTGSINTDAEGNPLAE